MEQRTPHKVELADMMLLDTITYSALTREGARICRHYYCAAVEYEALEHNTNVIDAQIYVIRAIEDEAKRRNSTLSEHFKDKGTMEFLFGKSSEVPVYTAYWLNKHYSKLFGEISELKRKRPATLYELQAWHVNARKTIARENYENERERRQTRRAVCKFYRDGKYTDTLNRLKNKDWDVTLPKHELCHAFIAVVTEIKDKNGGSKHLHTKRAAIRVVFGLSPFLVICVSI